MATERKTRGKAAADKPKPKTGPQRVDDRIVRIFLKSVGVEAGLYHTGSRDLVDGHETHHLYQSNLEIVRDVLKGGRMSAGELEAFIMERYHAGERQVLLSAILPKQGPARSYNEADNLLEAGTVYQHAALYVRTAPAFSFAGNSVITVRQGAGTAKETFTLKDLAQYYLAHVHVGYRAANMARLYGGMRYLLETWRLDEILTAIDLAGETLKPISVVKLEDFLPQAREETRMKEARRSER